MCVVSMVMDQYRTAWPPVDPVPNSVPNWIPSTTWPTVTITKEQETTALEAFEELCAAAKKLDEILGLPDCEDPKKAEWLETVRQRVREHELSKIEKRLGG